MLRPFKNCRRGVPPASRSVCSLFCGVIPYVLATLSQRDGQETEGIGRINSTGAEERSRLEGERYLRNGFQRLPLHEHPTLLSCHGRLRSHLGFGVRWQRGGRRDFLSSPRCTGGWQFAYFSFVVGCIGSSARIQICTH
jgi:hypothetical protein